MTDLQNTLPPKKAVYCDSSIIVISGHQLLKGGLRCQLVQHILSCSLSLSLSHHALPFSIAFGLGIFPLTPPFPSTSLAVICTPRSALTLIVTSTFPPFFTATMAASASTVPTFQAFSRISSSCVGFLGLVRVLIA